MLFFHSWKSLTLDFFATNFALKVQCLDLLFQGGLHQTDGKKTEKEKDDFWGNSYEFAFAGDK